MTDRCQDYALPPPDGPTNLRPGGVSFDAGHSLVGHRPDNLSGSRCRAVSPVARLQQGRATRLELQVRDYNGSPVDLSVPDGATPSPGDSVAIDGLRVFLVCKGAAGATGKRLLWVREGEIVHPTSGLVSFPLSAADANGYGIYAGQILVSTVTISAEMADQSEPPSGIVHSSRVWIEIAGNLLQTAGLGPPSIEEMRLFLRDTCPEGNELLGDFEFSDEEIVFSIVRTVDFYNGFNFPKTRHTAANMPRDVRYAWVNGIGAELLDIAARHYMREQLPRSGGGLAVDPKAKAGEYSAVAAQLRAEWRAAVEAYKAERNLSGGWGTFGSQWRA